MNEILFFIQVITVVITTFFFLRLGEIALSSLILLQIVLANLFVVKQMTVFSFQVTCSDVYVVGVLLGLNLIQEYFGKEKAKKLIYISSFFLFFFYLMFFMHLQYQPNCFDTTHSAFKQIFLHTPRIIGSSILVFFLIQIFNTWFFGLFKKTKILFLRMGVSLILSQLLDTILFSYLALYGIVGNIFHVICVSFIIKTIVIGCMTCILYFYKQKEKSYE